MNNHLPERLLKVAELVPTCRCVFDIGADHAYLPIQLVREDRCQFAVAADVRPGPLDRARRHIHELDLSERIETRLTDGLQNLNVAETDVVVIAGLGGNEIMDILAASLPDCLAIILQPMKSSPDLRAWLYQNGYRIDQETLAFDRGRYYPIMRCVWSGLSERLDLLSAWVGPVLLQNRPVHILPWLIILQARLSKQSRSQPELQGLAGRIGEIIAEQRARMS